MDLKSERYIDTNKSSLDICRRFIMNEGGFFIYYYTRNPNVLIEIKGVGINNNYTKIVSVLIKFLFYFAEEFRLYYVTYEVLKTQILTN